MQDSTLISPFQKHVWRGVLVVNVVYVLLQVFGEVGEGLDTLTRINEAFVDDNFRPYKNIR